MKRIRIVQAVLLVATAALLVSCGSGRQTAYADPYPPSRAGFSLVVHSYPGMVVHRYHDGRYYYSSPGGYRYWRGYDNRYYLDRAYLNRVRYDRSQYNAWKHGHKKYYRKHPRRR
jgi:hypothetical protein